MKVPMGYTCILFRFVITGKSKMHSCHSRASIQTEEMQCSKQHVASMFSDDRGYRVEVMVIENWSGIYRAFTV